MEALKQIDREAPFLTDKNVSRDCQVSPQGQKSYQLKTTALNVDAIIGKGLKSLIQAFILS